MIHRIVAYKEEISEGVDVEPVFVEEGRRRGLITDIEYFKVKG